MKIHLFETGVSRISDALNIQNLLKLYFNELRVNFDISDYDGRGEMVLRIESETVQPSTVLGVFQNLGFSCKELQ